MSTRIAPVSDETAHYDSIAGEDASPAAIGEQRSRARSIVFSVRLNPGEVAEIERVATTLDVPASALVRGWVLSGLATHHDTDAVTELRRAEETIRAIRRQLQHASQPSS